jgi:hypothetical protein
MRRSEGTSKENPAANSSVLLVSSLRTEQEADTINKDPKNLFLRAQKSARIARRTVRKLQVL